MKKYSKKHSMLKLVIEKADFGRYILDVLLVIAAFMLSFAEIYGVNRFQHLQIEYKAANIISLFFLNLIMIPLLILLCRWIKKAAKKVINSADQLKAIHNYCYLPLTADEIRDTGIKDPGLYFSFLSVHMCYSGGKWIQMPVEDFRKIILVCVNVFGIDELFSMDPNYIESFLTETLGYKISCDFTNFLREYSWANNSNKIANKSCRQTEDGKVTLAFTVKD